MHKLWVLLGAILGQNKTSCLENFTFCINFEQKYSFTWFSFQTLNHILPSTFGFPGNRFKIFENHHRKHKLSESLILVGVNATKFLRIKKITFWQRKFVDYLHVHKSVKNSIISDFIVEWCRGLNFRNLFRWHF